MNNSGINITVGGDFSNSGQFGVGENITQIEESSSSDSDIYPALVEIAGKIEQILRDLEKNNPSATDQEKVAVVNANISAQSPLRLRLLSAIHQGWEKALEKVISNPYLEVATAAIKGWSNPK